jgi:hypothetical protein
MSRLRQVVESTPATPNAGVVVWFADSGNKKHAQRNESGFVETLNGLVNFSSAAQAGFASDTYLTGSALAVPQHKLQVGTCFRWRFDVTKTAAGVATPTVNIRVGTGGVVGDTSRVLFTLPAQTAAVDAGRFDILATMRGPLGAVGILVGQLQLTHNVPAGITGLSTTIAPNIVTVSAGFDVTVANLIVGLSVNGGASAAWTVQLVQSKMWNI